MLSRLFVCAGGSGAVAQLRERFGAAGREGFAQTAREKENKANFSFIPFKEKQNLPPLALHKLKRRLNPCLEKKPHYFLHHIFQCLSLSVRKQLNWKPGFIHGPAPLSLQEEALGASFLQGQISSFSLSWLVAQVTARALFDFYT